MSAPTTQRDSGLWIVVAIVLLVVLVPATMMLTFWGTGMMGGGWTGMGGTGWSWLGVLAGVAVLVVVLVLVVRAIQAQPRAAYPSAWPQPTVPWQGAETAGALRILDERYAKGEISRDEYLRVRADLEARVR